MLQLLMGRAGTGKTRTMFRRLRENKSEKTQILLVPEQYSHDTERRLCRELDNRPECQVLTFTRLYDRVCDRAGGGARPYLDAGGRLLLMYTALCRSESGLTVYRRPSGRRAFLSGLIETADECKRYRVSPDQLLEAGESLGGLEGDKMRDLGLILGTYDRLTSELAADPRDRLTRLGEAVTACGWPADFHFWVDHFTEFTPQELDVLDRLLRNGNDLTVMLTCDSLDGEDDDIFAPARRTAHILLRLAEEAGVPAEAEIRTGTDDRVPVLIHLEENLFARPGQPWTEECPELRLFCGESARDEVEYAASTILELVRERGFRFRDFIVTARNFDRYADLLESVFDQCGIPLFLSTKDSILEKPVLTLITAALDTVAGRYRHEDLFRYLKTGLTDLDDDRRDRLENYAVTWSLRGSRWTGKGDWTMHPLGFGLEFREEDREALAEINESRRQVTEPLERLRKNRDRTGRGYTLALYRLLEEIGLPGRLKDRADELDDSGDRKLADEYRQLWSILTGAMEQCARLLGDREMELKEFADLFKLMLSQYDVGTIPVSLDRVTAAGADRAIHRKARYLIFLGADGDSLPDVSPIPGILSERERELLARQGVELAPASEDRLTREMGLIYNTCVIPSEGLLVTWPRQTGQTGEEGRPSFLVERLRVLYPKIREERENTMAARTPGLALDLAGRDPDAAAALSRLEADAPEVERVLNASEVTRDSLSPEAVRLLYGSEVSMSATRMNLCRSCHFSYFMRYGLRARELQPAGFHAPEYGTFVHAVLEYVLSRKAAGSAETPEALVDQAFEKYAGEVLGGLSRETPRFGWTFRHLKRSVLAVAKNALDELAVSEFRPMSFELGFGKGRQLPPIRVEKNGLALSVSGIVDRVDGWEHDGKMYLRVMDYKTGKQKFSFTDIANGLSQQMLLYLFALSRGDFGGRPAESAGVLYIHAAEPVLKGKRGISEEKCREEADKQLRRDGLVLNDGTVLRAMEDWGTGKPRFLPREVAETGEKSEKVLATRSQMELLSGKVTGTLEDIAAEMAAGNVAADPYWRSADVNACRYCEFRQACQFEECFGDRRRWQPDVKPEEFWRDLERERRERHGVSAD